SAGVVSFDLAVRKRSPRSCAGKSCPLAADCRLQAKAKAAPTGSRGPLFLDRTVPRGEGLAASLVHRSSGHGGALAAGAFPPILGEPVAEIRNTRTTAGQP